MVIVSCYGYFLWGTYTCSFVFLIVVDMILRHYIHGHVQYVYIEINATYNVVYQLQVLFFSLDQQYLNMKIEYSFKSTN